MPVHTEHHLYPSIPFHSLPDAHTAMRARPGVPQRGDNRWQVGFVRTLRP
ncbi:MULTISPECIES: fatty acid desaturase [unclassified Methylobacterium]|jgi:fatty acid desaturase|nr:MULTISPECIES: fatty acid desaturase [unclassified Methylobacterium]MDE4909309.1 fatty acid desaturase [Methylobacterium sp. 092160098-2]SFV03397.1 Fatty acid desaturase [Methylobacterium sp. UNCCL125]